MIDAFRRLDRRAKLAVVIVVLVAAGVGAAIYWRSYRPINQVGPTTTSTTTSRGPAGPPAPSISAGVQMLLGNPSGATPDPANRTTT